MLKVVTTFGNISIAGKDLYALPIDVGKGGGIISVTHFSATSDGNDLKFGIMCVNFIDVGCQLPVYRTLPSAGASVSIILF